KEVSRVVVDRTKPYQRVVRNLYAVPTPLINGATESKIEDFFDATIKTTVIGGKTFNDKNDFDEAMHYGKKVFAHNVVRPNADSINFDGFRPLLVNLTSVITAHSSV